MKSKSIDRAREISLVVAGLVADDGDGGWLGAGERGGAELGWGGAARSYDRGRRGGRVGLQR